MNNQENPNMGPFLNVPGTVNPWHAQPDVKQSPYYKAGLPPMVAGANAYQMLYPEIWYKMQPFIMMANDEMDLYNMNPTREMLDGMTDRIYDDMRRMYPDMEEYASDYEKKALAQNPSSIDPPFRRRGMFRDFISILLLSELFRRRRRMPYPFIY